MEDNKTNQGRFNEVKSSAGIHHTFSLYVSTCWEIYFMKSCMIWTKIAVLTFTMFIRNRRNAYMLCSMILLYS